MQLSIVIPVLNDVKALSALLRLLRLPEYAGVEVLVADGGSDDGSAAAARALGADAVLVTPAGRGAQLAAATQFARGTWIWCLHADSTPDPGCVPWLLALPDQPGWGRFSVGLDGSLLLRLVGRSMNLRSRLTGIATGDQGIFVHRALLSEVGGVPRQPLMEDIELSRRLRRLTRPRCPTLKVHTSPRRWQRNGVLRTIFAMWRFRLRYWWGADPIDLARDYYRRPPGE